MWVRKAGIAPATTGLSRARSPPELHPEIDRRGNRNRTCLITLPKRVPSQSATPRCSVEPSLGIAPSPVAYQATVPFCGSLRGRLVEKEGNAPSRARLQGVPLVFQHPHSVRSAAHTGAAPVSTDRRSARDADRVMSQWFFLQSRWRDSNPAFVRAKRTGRRADQRDDRRLTRGTASMQRVVAVDGIEPSCPRI